jgi:ADP-heptose:LPS heptosyltransferase
VRESVKRLLLKCFLSPGDVVMLTAAVRDLHRAHPGRFATDVRTTAQELWEHNPHLTPLDDHDPRVRVIDMHYPLIHQSNHAPYHFIHGFAQHLEEQLGVRIPLTRFHGDIHLGDHEKEPPRELNECGVRGNFWIVVAGGKYDYTAKWWDPGRYQTVVDHFRGTIEFVQCGEAGHWHPPLEHVVNLVGKTDTRQFVRLMYHADGVLCPVTFAMHLAAAVETKPSKPKNRACVVVAGGREPAQWEAYPHHQYLSTNGALDCCDDGGCWKSRCQPVGDGDPKDEDLCLYPVALTPDLQIPRCLAMITPQDVIRRVELYYEGGALAPNVKPRTTDH